MDDDLQKIKRWSSHGSVRQFYSEVSARAAAAGYRAELDGETITFYRAEKRGGFLGIGRRAAKEPVLRIIRHGDSVEIPTEGVDEQVVHELARILHAH